jgi:hypothetical protein
MTRISSIKSALVFFAAILAGCGAADGGIDEGAQAMNGSEAKKAAGYGYEMLPLTLAQSDAPIPSSDGKIGEGRIAPEKIVEEARAHLPELRACYAEALKRDPALRGQVVVGFSVEQDGKVRKPEVLRSTVGDAGLAACITKTFGAFSMPASPAGEMRVEYPVELAPEDLAKGAGGGA